MRPSRDQLRGLRNALIFGAFGAALVHVAMLDPRDEAFRAGRPVVLGCGLAILLLGTAASLPLLRDVARASRAWAALGALALALLIVPPAWVAVARGVFPGARGPPPRVEAVRPERLEAEDVER